MLIALPIITVEEFFRDVPTSSQYGADVIYRSWKDCESNKTSISCENFEQQMTMYIGYHHRQYVTNCDSWFNQAFSNDCKLDLGWVGFLHKDGGSSVSKPDPIF